jgi:hypothetical protein
MRPSGNPSSIRGYIPDRLDSLILLSKLFSRRWPLISTRQWLENLRFPDASKIDYGALTFSSTKNAKMVYLMIETLLRFKVFGLTSIVTSKRPGGTTQKPRLSELEQLAVADSALTWLRRLLGERRCIWNALAVSSALNSHGHTSMLVFGFNSSPYSGRTAENIMHVWVETDQSDLSLVWGNMNDYLEVNRCYLRARPRIRWRPRSGPVVERAA